MKAERTLQDVFGFSSFREGQREVVEILLAGRSALALFPTGGGKSLCYQLPALELEGLTLVVSPLIALMKDQVEALTARGVAAARLDSSLGSAEVADIFRRMDSGELKLLYVAPERLANEGFLRQLSRVRIALLAVDEAHCISEWGHNFRPDYLKLAAFAEDMEVGRVLALTATATPRVAADIRERFGIGEKDHVQTGFARPNLIYGVIPCSVEERKDILLSRLREQPGESSIVYVTLQRTAEEVAAFLTDGGLVARAYHAGMRADHRAEVQEGFMSGDIPVVVATIAFGMGIDKADIRAVYHYNLPKSLENYAQESGRAGRDGKPARCEILACLDDRTVLENFVHGDTPSRSALKSLVEHLVLRGREFDISRYDLSASKDMRPLVVATALTQLELQGLLESRGPFYADFRFRFIEPMERILAGHTEARQQFLKRLFDAAVRGRVWHRVEVARAADQLGEDEGRIRRALQYLGDSGDIELKPSGLRHAYRLRDGAETRVEVLAGRLGELFEKKERDEIGRVAQVLELCRAGECLPRALSGHFGEEIAACGSCSACAGKFTGGELPGGNGRGIATEDVAVIQEIRSEDHAALRQGRQIARFLCGLSSPATTRAKLHRDPRFGVLAEHPFLEVLAQVESLGLAP